jgi:hypothetical protein
MRQASRGILRQAQDERALELKSLNISARAELVEARLRDLGSIR